MEYTTLGSTGLLVSRICIGCMSFGDPSHGRHPWTLDEGASQALLRQALDAGITFFDTANVYSAGSSEEITGRALLSLARRDEVVIATKVSQRMGPGPNGEGLSRGAIMTQVDASLRRLGTDYIDLYQIHRVDPHTAWEETLEALHDVVKAGKVRYVGASSMYAWQFTKALFIADLHNWTRFVSMQNHYNLLYREEEREMLPLCRDQDIAVMPWSPLARGRLARPADEITERSKTDATAGHRYQDSASARIVDAVGSVASNRGAPRAQIALAWLLSRPGITAPIVGATKPRHIDDAVAAVEICISDEEVKLLEEPYRPVAVAGH
jgi:aryl-alcohol dehydrogenase-like predicted oxidoreductase